MNRNEEYTALLQELEQTPPALNDTVQRALLRKKALQRKRRIFGIPAGSLAACFVGFVLLVNLFPPFAMACGNIPLLRELAKAVAWSPSLSAAVEHDYVQPMNQTQTANGVTAEVEYVIVDRKQVSIFYTLTGSTDRVLEADAEISGAHGSTLEGFSTSSNYGTSNGELRQVDVSFIETDVPSALDLTLRIYASGWGADGLAMDAPAEAVTGDFGDELLTDSQSHDPAYLAELTFTLEFDPTFTAQGEVVAVDQTFRLDGQTVTITEAEIYPTHLRLNLAYDAANTAWLRDLNFYLENEHGDRFEGATNGISATGDPEGTPAMLSFWMDSPYFSQGEHLTLHITGAAWLDKNRERVEIDLVNATGKNLPDGVRIEWAEKRAGGWILSTSTPYRWGSTCLYGTWSMLYYDAEGNEYDANGCSMSHSLDFLGTLSGQALEEFDAYAAANTDRYFEMLPLKGCDTDTVYLSPNFTTVTTESTPISVPIR